MVGFFFCSKICELKIFDISLYQQKNKNNMDVKETKNTITYTSSYDECKQEALKHKDKVEFYVMCRPLYYIADKNGWLDEFFPKK